MQSSSSVARVRVLRCTLFAVAAAVLCACGSGEAPDSRSAAAAGGASTAVDSASTAASGTSVAAGGTSVAAAAHARSGMGMNLDRPVYWQSDWPFIDEMKRAGAWTTSCDPWSSAQCTGFTGDASSYDTREESWLTFDENGWPTRLPAADDPTVKFRKVSVLLFQGDGGSHPAGRYVVLYDGNGTLAYGGEGNKLDAESRPGRDVVEIATPTGGGLTVSITGIDPSNHLRNIRVIGPGGVCSDAPAVWVDDASRCAPGAAWRSLEALSATQTFHPAYVADLTGFRALRFMKWSSPNTSQLASWARRPKPGDALWSGDDGVPYEAMFELARATGADPWINMPSRVDDDFAQQLARLAKSSLAPGATLWLEYGNEPWNQAPPYSDAGVLFQQMAAQKWPGANLEPWRQRLNWYAYRSVQLCRIVKQEFGADASRVRCVANGQAASAEVSRTILACELASGELGKACGRELDALAVAPYFGYYLGEDAYASTVDAWAAEPDGGLDSIFREINGHALPEAKDWNVASKQAADEYGLPLVGYEGGQHLVTYSGGKAEALFLAANRDPRMGAALRTLAADWKDAGGQLFMAFSYTERPSPFGSWGMKEYQRDDAAPKWQAIKALRDGACWWSGC
jgi:hypothetical protein